MRQTMTLGDFLVAYLRKIGVRHVFGIPGDLALKLFFALGRKHDLEDSDVFARARGRALPPTAMRAPPAKSA